jgi:hypothetical protein
MLCSICAPLPEYRPQLDVSLVPEDDRKFLVRLILSENLHGSISENFDLRNSDYHLAVFESLNSQTLHFRMYVDKNCFYYLHIRNSFMKLCPVIKSKSKLIYDRQSVGQSVLVSGAHLGPATNFYFSLKFSLDSCGFVIL